MASPFNMSCLRNLAIGPKGKLSLPDIYFWLSPGCTPVRNVGRVRAKTRCEGEEIHEESIWEQACDLKGAETEPK